MVRTRKGSRPVFDILQDRETGEYETSSGRIRAKLRDPYQRGFCELCWRSSEYAIAEQARKVCARLDKVRAQAVPITDSMIEQVRSETEAVVFRYKEALAGKHGPWECGKLMAAYCDPVDMGRDRSIEAFRDQVQHVLLMAAWARRGNMMSAARLPGQPKSAPKPNKLYCECHNPRRSDDARRAYQRDRRFEAEYRLLIRLIWMTRAGELPTSDIQAHRNVRREAYYHLQKMKKTPTDLIDDLQARGVTSQAEIARKLGISRQAVSAAIKRRKVMGIGDARS